MASAHYALVPAESEPLPLPNEGSKEDIRQELAEIYQSYAEIYPNPQIANEHLERDRLLQQVRQELLAKQQETAPIETKKNSGFFGRLFGKREAESRPADVLTNINEDEYLEYSTVDSMDDDEQQDGSLCGTQSALAINCIPQEAHSVARFHLASASRSRPILVRQTQDPLVIVGMGVVAEHVNNAWRIEETSDKDELKNYVASLDAAPFSLSHVRCTAIGPNALAVSWGLADGNVVIYRRIAGFGDKLGWESVAMMGPTRAVLENLQATGDVFLQNSDGSLSSQSLRVTDIVVAMVDIGQGESTATLILSRLGGYLELIPLETTLWHGPVLTPQSHQRAKRKKSRRGVVPHYAVGHLDNIASDETRIAALTTLEHHDDIMTIEVFRTSVGGDTEWDEKAYPDSPPAEFVLAVSGTKDSSEVITFWSMSTIFSENLEDKSVSLHAGFLDSFAVPSVGVSLFANDDITQHWRKRRRVTLRSSVKRVDDDAREPPARPRISTLSILAPVVSLRFSINDSGSVSIAAMDYSGGITVADCTLLVGLAAQTLSRDVVRLEEDRVPLVYVTLSRTQMAQRTLHSGRTVAMEWLRPDTLVLATLPGKLQIVETRKDSRKSSFISTSSMTKGVKIHVDSEGQASLISNYNGLTVCQLQSLDPVTIIQRLAQASKYEEAIAAAEGLSSHPGVPDVLETCHKQLWETTRSVENLGRVVDDSYVIQQVLGMFTRDVQSQFDISQARKACCLAVARLQKARLATALQLGGDEGVDAVKEKVTALYVKLGTFSCLCDGYDVEPSVQVFRENFMTVSMVELAKSVALKGDVDALAVLLFRHRKELRDAQLDIIAQVPLALNPASYCHLLPVCSENADRFVTDDRGLRPWSAMQFYVKDKSGKSLLLEGEDIMMLSGQEVGVHGDETSFQKAELASAYLDRANRLQQVAGELPLLISLCDFLLRCLGEEIQHPPPRDIEAVAILYSIRMCAYYLDEMMMSGRTFDERMAKVSVSEIQGLTLSDIIRLILGSPEDPMEVFSRFQKYVQPILSLPGIVDAFHNQDQAQQMELVDDAIASYCAQLVRRESSRVSDSPASNVGGFRNALSIISAIAKSSRSSIRQESRLIKSRKVLINLALTVAYDSTRVSEDLSLLPSDCRYVVDRLWEVYECLPNQLPPPEETNTIMIGLNADVDELYRHLIAVDLMSRWCPQTSLRYLSELKASSNLATIGMNMASEMCKAFSLQSRGEESLLDLLEDIDQLRQSLGSFEDESALQQQSVKSLLTQGQFDILAYLFSTARPHWIEIPQLRRAVISFVNDAMFGGNERDPTTGNKLDLAIRCQDTLGPSFPDLLESFQSMRRHLDAAYFINTTLCGNGGSLVTPADIRDMSPLDVVERVLIENPQAALEGCADWADPRFGRKANVISREFYTKRDRGANSPVNQNQLPPLPGGAIFHLAVMVGLESPTARIVVKSRVAHHATTCDMPWMAAALCLNLLYDEDEAFSSGPEAAVILESVSNVVSVESYSDVATKKALCLEAFSRFQHNTSCFESDALTSILGELASLELKTSRFHRASWETTGSSEGEDSGHGQEHAEFLVFRAVGAVANIVGHHGDATHTRLDEQVLSQRPIDRVYMDTLSEYKTDLHELFSILQQKAFIGERDDPLLLSLSRLLLFWCIASTTLSRPENVEGSLEQAVVSDVVALAGSLLFHVQQKAGLQSNTSELREILETQTAAAIERVSLHAQPASVKPDLGIVRALVGRGYTENGARRAAVMTNNESVETAMVWAVRHSLDSSFNDPIMFLKSPTEVHIDQRGIQEIKEILVKAEILVKGSSDVVSFLPKRERDLSLLDALPVPPSVSKQTRIESSVSDNNKTSAKSTVVEDERRSIEDIGSSGRKPSTRSVGFASKQPPPTKQTAESKSKSADVSLKVHMTCAPSQETKSVPKKSQASLSERPARAPPEAKPASKTAPEEAPQPKAPPAASKEDEPAPSSKPLVRGGSLVRPRPPPPPRRARPPPPPTTADRSALRRQGQLVLQQRKSKSSELDSEEKRRLISEGKKLLEKNRKPTTEPSAGAKRYNLRSAAKTEAPARAPEPETKKEDDAKDDDGWDFDDF